MFSTANSRRTAASIESFASLVPRAALGEWKPPAINVHGPFHVNVYLAEGACGDGHGQEANKYGGEDADDSKEGLFNVQLNFSELKAETLVDLGGQLCLVCKKRYGSDR